MNDRRLKSLTSRQFDKVLSREGITITDYYTNDKYDVFFRRETRSTNPTSNVRIFYKQDCGLKIGTIFTLKDKQYIIYSQDGLESDVYYTSIAVQCDTNFNVNISGNEYKNVPVVVTSNSHSVNHGSVFSTVSGSVVIYTQDNEYSRKIKVNDSFLKFGNYYSVTNRFISSDIVYINLEQKLMPSDSYSIVYSGLSALSKDDYATYQLTYSVTNNGSYIEPQPLITYTSSNESVATVDSNGLLTLVGAGVVTITATDTEHNISTTNNITISEHTRGYESITITTTSTTLTASEQSYKTLTAKALDSSGSDVTTTVFSADKTITWKAVRYYSSVNNSINPLDITDTYCRWLDGATSNIKKINLNTTYPYYNGETIRVYLYIDGEEVSYIDLTTRV